MRPEPLQDGRYELYAQIGAGGMATVHLGKLRGARGFSRVVAIKRLFPHLVSDAEVVAMFLDEARLASRIEHPNVVRVTDVVGNGHEIFLVMDYVPGITLADLVLAHQGTPLPLPIALRVMHDALTGLSAAHHATSQGGKPLRIVHRDVSPQNLLIGADGITRLLDFGIAKADERMQQRTRTNETKGKLAYMAPEQLAGEAVDERTDLYAAGVCLWEIATGKRAYAGSDAHVMRQIMEQPLAPASAGNAALPASLDALLDRATAKEPADRFGTAAEMARSIEALSIPLAPLDEVRSLLEAKAGSPLAERAKLVARIEASDPADVAHAPVGAEGIAVDTPPHEPDRSGFGRWHFVLGTLLFLLGAVALWFELGARLSERHAVPTAEASVRAPEAVPPAPTATSVDTARPAATSADPRPEPPAKRPTRPAGSNRRETLY